MDITLARPGDPAVAFFIFNRPDTTQAVFERIAAARPRRLLVVADGPRESRPGEEELCRATRRVLDGVDWPCEVQTNFSTTNVGCRRRVSSGLDWVFEQAEEAIVLEDDCLPDPTFFRFCAELLERYRDDDRIGHIGGVNLQPRHRTSPYSYYFSHYTHVWGWASWRRAWRDYDVAMGRWPAWRDSSALAEITGSTRSAEGWRSRFESVYSGEVDTWDYQLVFAHWAHQRLSITPSSNLVSNIGFRADATHTSGDSPLANRPVSPMSFPLRHPPTVATDVLADAYTQRQYFDAPSFPRRVWSAASRLLARGTAR